MNNSDEIYLQRLQDSRSGIEWVECMEDYVDYVAVGRVDYAAQDHTAFWVDRGDTLLIVIETANEIASRSDGCFPTGWHEAAENGWSYLLLCWEHVGEYPLDTVVTFLKEQSEAGDFKQYQNIVIHGAKQRTQAAFACASVIRGCTVVITQPEFANSSVLHDLLDLSTLSGSRLIAAFDPTDCREFPPKQLTERMEYYELRCWHLTKHTDDLLRSFGVLPKLFEVATSAQITLSWAYPLLRKRREVRFYWRSVLQRIDPQRKPTTYIRLCKNVIPLTGGRVFKQKLQELEAKQDLTMHGA